MSALTCGPQLPPISTDRPRHAANEPFFVVVVSDCPDNHVPVAGGGVGGVVGGVVTVLRVTIFAGSTRVLPVTTRVKFVHNHIPAYPGWSMLPCPDRMNCPAAMGVGPVKE